MPETDAAKHGSEEEPPRSHVSAQAFFAQYDTESRKSSYGVFEREFIKGFLARAAAAGLYDPNQ